MKKHLLLLLGILIAMPALARDFDYTYEGKTLTYTVLDEIAKTVTTKLGSTDLHMAGNWVSGKLILPPSVYDGEGIEYTLTEIGMSGFAYCSDLESVILPKTIVEVGTGAFNYCSKLKYVGLPEGLEQIMSYAFESCNSLMYLTIPGSVTRIGDKAFYDCDSIKTFTFALSQKELTIEGLFTLHSYMDSLVINRKIPGCSGAHPKHIIFGEGIDSITPNCFANITSILSVTLPSTLKSIGESSFYECSNLESINFPSSLTEIGPKAFYRCQSLKDVRLPKHLRSIAESTFTECSELKDVILPDDIEQINSNAFNHCTNLDSIFTAAKTPPVCGSEVFASEIYPKTVLTVPIGSKRKYAAADTWKNFVNIYTEGTLLVTVDYDHTMGEVKLNGEAVDRLELDEGDPLDVAITPAVGFALESITANGEDCTEHLDKDTLHYDEISDTLDIAVKFAPIKFDITLPSKLNGGYIEVNGRADAPSQLQYGSRVELHPVADEGYLFKSMSVNGVVVTLDSDGVYTIASLTESITVDAVFEIIRLKATANYNSAKGTVTLNGETGETLIDYGSSLTVKATPTEGHYVGSIAVNGSAVALEQLTEPVVIDRVTEDVNVEVGFDIYTYTVAATYDNAMGSVSINGSEGSADVDWGTDAEVVITPAYGYQIASVVLDDNDVSDEVDANGRLTIKAVKADSKLTVAFEIKRVSVSIALEGGELMTIHDFGSELRYVPIPEKDWQFHSATVGSQVIMSLDNDGSFIVGPLTEDTMVSVVFTNKTTGVVASVDGDDAITVTVRNRTVVIAGAQDDAVAEVYDTAGLRCYCGLKRTIDLDKAGLYIVTISGQSFKVILR